MNGVYLMSALVHQEIIIDKKVVDSSCILKVA